MHRCIDALRARSREKAEAWLDEARALRTVAADVGRYAVDRLRDLHQGGHRAADPVEAVLKSATSTSRSTRQSSTRRLRPRAEVFVGTVGSVKTDMTNRRSVRGGIQFGVAALARLGHHWHHLYI
jgi:hypothetical protein